MKRFNVVGRAGLAVALSLSLCPIPSYAGPVDGENTVGESALGSSTELAETDAVAQPGNKDGESSTEVSGDSGACR